MLKSALMDDTLRATIVTLCTQVLMRYAVVLDEFDYAALTPLFTEDATFDWPGVPLLSGRAAIRAHMERLQANRVAQNPHGHIMRHLFTTVWIDPVSDSAARGVSYALFFRAAEFA